MSSPDLTPTTARSGSDRHAPPPRAPGALRWLVVGIAASIVLLVGLPVLMLVKRTELVAAIERETPGTLSEEWMGWIVVFALAYAIVLHLVDVVLLLWLTPRILRGRRWARITLTVYLVVATAGSLYSATMGGMYLAVVIPTDILHVIMVALLWAPPSVRRFFAAHRAARRGAAAQDAAQPNTSR
ncbi:MAG: hypothetical protein L0G94_13670 [Brachybacterium sp.]|uniref:hypothetical protein n=1 Tax=Brachybacterium sp. TaxID=1891286 RepID=UPI0026470B15|nr:hypothetical protein [Brachybacterium sp.]MDN5687701.1 hypothetical protein [Brachybacterium sp.]